MERKDTFFAWPVGWLCAGLAALGMARAEVQIVQLQDAKLEQAKVALPDATGGAGWGVADRFCVINTTGRAVRLRFSTARAGSASASRQPTLINSQTGAVLAYRQSVALADGSQARVLSLDAGEQSTFDVPAFAVARSAALCPTGGNVMKWITLSLPGSATGLYADQVSIRASSL